MTCKPALGEDVASVLAQRCDNMIVIGCESPQKDFGLREKSFGLKAPKRRFTAVGAFLFLECSLFFGLGYGCNSLSSVNGAGAKRFALALWSKVYASNGCKGNKRGATPSFNLRSVSREICPLKLLTDLEKTKAKFPLSPSSQGLGVGGLLPT